MKWLVIENVKGGGWGRAIGKWERGCVKCNMMGQINFTGGRIKALITPKVFRISKENTSKGTWLEFVRLCGRDVGIESAPEGAKMII